MKSIVIAAFTSILAIQGAAADGPATELVAHEGGTFVIEASPGGVARCRPATESEARALARRPDLPLHVITPPRAPLAATAGLKINLRSTSQLDAYPDAKAAFIRAAQYWEAKIASPVTIILDVDYGPTRFGQPWPSPNILGSTDSQQVGANGIWSSVRGGFITTANGGTETSLMNQLPTGTIPTNLGSTSYVVAPTAPLRALGIISSVADPATEGGYGNPPSIGFNSGFPFDTNPDDGVSPGTYDFNTTAIHEIGHALGFTSNAGVRELSPSFPISVSTLDAFRFSAGQGPGNFTNAQRWLSSGGSQSFYAGGTELAMSTGRPDGTGGDGQQASHWKADEKTGVYIGIMDPTLASGTKGQFTANDTAAFETLGWAMTSGGSGGGGTCTPDATTLCLSSGRFKVQADYRDYGGHTGSGNAVSLTSDSGYFWFFSSTNVELVAKMVSFCNGSSGNWAIYASGLTDVAVTFKVTDVQNGTYKEYSNTLGNRFCTIADGPFTCP